MSLVGLVAALTQQRLCLRVEQDGKKLFGFSLQLCEPVVVAEGQPTELQLSALVSSYLPLDG